MILFSLSLFTISFSFSEHLLISKELRIKICQLNTQIQSKKKIKLTLCWTLANGLNTLEMIILLSYSMIIRREFYISITMNNLWIIKIYFQKVEACSLLCSLQSQQKLTGHPHCSAIFGFSFPFCFSQ